MFLLLGARFSFEPESLSDFEPVLLAGALLEVEFLESDLSSDVDAVLVEGLFDDGCNACSSKIE